MTLTRTFPNDAKAVQAARQFVLESLGGYASELIDVAELLISELATNSVRHTDSAFEVTVAADSSRIRLTVTDDGSGQPVVRRPHAGALSGRGLALVDQFSASWGVEPSKTGKTVWLVLNVSDHASECSKAARSTTAHSQASGSAAPLAKGPRAAGRFAPRRGPDCVAAGRSGSPTRRSRDLCRAPS